VWKKPNLKKTRKVESSFPGEASAVNRAKRWKKRKRERIQMSGGKGEKGAYLQTHKGKETLKDTPYYSVSHLSKGKSPDGHPCDEKDQRKR